MSVRVVAACVGVLLLAACGDASSELPKAKIRPVSEYYGFVAADGNIGCVMSADSVRCDIDKRSWTPPKDTTKCRLDYGHGIWLPREEKPAFVCAGDTTLYAGPEVAGGHGVRSGTMTCAVSKATVTCTNGDHGFDLSAKSYRLF